MSGRYHGSPMRAHIPLSLVGDHFDRWLDLFEQTAREVCPPAAAALFIDKARRIADSFEMASATVAGRIRFAASRAQVVTYKMPACKMPA
jgi:hemoglobin